MLGKIVGVGIYQSKRKKGRAFLFLEECFCPCYDKVLEEQGREVMDMERLQYICTTEDQGLEVLTLLRREFRVSTNLLRQL